MANPSDSFLSGANIDFIEAQYARFLDDPATVEPSWRELFGSLQRDGRPLITDGLVLAAPLVTRGNGHGAATLTPGVAGEIASMRLQSKVDQTVFTYRLRGHLNAQLDPLDVPARRWTTSPTSAWSAPRTSTSRSARPGSTRRPPSTRRASR